MDNKWWSSFINSINKVSCPWMLNYVMMDEFMKFTKKNGKLNVIKKNHPFWMKVGWIVSSMNNEVGDNGWTSSMKN
jgi:hypothetical protein